jgi:four helix bundle protein
VERTKQAREGTKDEVARTKQRRRSRKCEAGWAEQLLAKDGPAGARQTGPSGRVYDLNERTARFGEDVIRLARGTPKTVVTIPVISQLVRSSTSVGANYMEAGAAQSGKDFDHKVGICKKEARETMHWLRMLAVADDSTQSDCRVMWQEAHELTMTFSSTLRKRRS